jgi:hypothetical protein
MKKRFLWIALTFAAAKGSQRIPQLPDGFDVRIGENIFVRRKNRAVFQTCSRGDNSIFKVAYVSRFHG